MTKLPEKRKSLIIEQYKSNDKAKHVLLIMGGGCAEHEVSLSSGKGILNSLKNLGYTVTAIDPGYDLAEQVMQIKPDVVFNAMHGTLGEDGNIPGALNILRVPYTHSGLTASAICFDKILTRRVVEAHGIKMAPCKILTKDHTDVKIEPMPRPYVIKPVYEGSSIGVEVILEDEDYKFADYKWEYGNKLIVEKYILGQEIQVAVIDGKAVGALEIKTSRKFYDYEAKYVPGASEHIYPAQLPVEKYQEVLSLSEKVFNLLGCSDVGRVEFIYNSEEQEFYFLEINTHPGFTPTSIVPEICAHIGMSYDQLVDLLVKKADAVKL